MIEDVKENGKRMEYLRELTENLPQFPIEIEPHFAGTKEHKIECGTSLSWNLLNQDEVSCARWFLSNNSEFPVHTHEEREWIIVYKGSLYLKIEDDEEKRLLPGCSISIEPNKLHSAKTIEDCWYLAITIPKSKSWPE